MTAFDLSPEMIAVGKRKKSAAGVPNLTLVEGDVGALPFDDNSFDTVFAVFGLHEVPTATRRRAVREAARVLRPSGRFVTVDLDRPTSAGTLKDVYFRVLEPRHAREVCGDGLSKLLSDNGFDIATHDSAGRWQPTQAVVATRRR